MKHSIKNIISNMKIFFFLITFLMMTTTLLLVELEFSYIKVDNLQEQKSIISTLTNYKKSKAQLAVLEFNGKSKELLLKIDELKYLSKFDYTSQYVFKDNDKYIKQLNKLKKLTKLFNATADDYYESKLNRKELKFSFNLINSKIDSIIIQTYDMGRKKVRIILYFAISIFFLMFVGLIWYTKRVTKIYKDILSLFSLKDKRFEYKPFSQEIDALTLRFKRKPIKEEKIEDLDLVTKIPNLKGLFALYNEKKGMKKGYFTTVTTFEIDNFSKTKRPFSPDVVQNMLKKVASSISLYEKVTDVFARTDYNQFTVVIVRSRREELLKEVEKIQKTISQLKFNIPNQGIVELSASAGYYVKENSKTLEEALKQSRLIVEHAKTKGANSLAQSSDLNSTSSWK